jgi:5-methylcytosine-specific restriction endonuclease McrA
MPNFPKSKRSKYYFKREPFQGRKYQNRDVYDSKRWRDLRTTYIKNNPLCEECLKNDIYTDATGRRGVVDHKVPINEGGSTFDTMNLQTLCNVCHNRKSGKEAHSNKDLKK